MSLRSMTLLLCATLPALALAGDPELAPDLQAGWEQRMARAAALQSEAASRQQAADQRLQEEQKACFRKFLVNACQAEAKKVHIQATRESRRLENEGKAIERAVHREQLIEEDRQRAARLPQREADLEKRADETSAARQAAEQRAEALREDKARQAEAGEKRKAEEEEKYRRKRAAHDARVARKMQKAVPQADDSKP